MDTARELSETGDRAEMSENLQVIINSVYTTCRLYESRMNMKKTKAFEDWKGEGNSKYFINGERVEKVNCFKNLIVQFTEDRNTFEQIKDIINRGYAALGELSKTSPGS